MAINWHNLTECGTNTHNLTECGTNTHNLTECATLQGQAQSNRMSIFGEGIGKDTIFLYILRNTTFQLKLVQKLYTPLEVPEGEWTIY